MKRVLTSILLIAMIFSLVSCNAFEESSSEEPTFSSYKATLVCPEDKNFDGKSIDVSWQRSYYFGTPKYEHYSFDGWTCGEDKLTSMGIWPYNSSATLVAKWIPVTYSIDFLMKSNFNDAYLQYNIETEDFYLPTPKPLDGKMFIGWSGEDITAPTKIVKISKGSYGNREYSGNWLNESEIKYKRDGFAFEIIDDYVSIIGYYGETTDDLYIPQEYNGRPVKAVSKGALYGISNHFKRLHIPNTVTTFDDYALGSGWAIVIENGSANEWRENSTFGIGNGLFSE